MENKRNSSIRLVYLSKKPETREGNHQGKSDRNAKEDDTEVEKLFISIEGNYPFSVTTK